MTSNESQIDLTDQEIEWDQLEEMLEEVICHQKRTLLRCAQRIIPHATTDDLLQPNDFPELEFNPQFRFEEGMLCGMETVRTVLRAYRARKKHGLD